MLKFGTNFFEPKKKRQTKALMRLSKVLKFGTNFFEQKKKDKQKALMSLSFFHITRLFACTNFEKSV